MNNRIKAIETRYAGCHFRSRLEARWAVFFDHLDIPWEYEPEGFETSAGNYLPDFRIGDSGGWFEVKPEGAPADPRHSALVELTEKPLIVARGMARSGVDQYRADTRRFVYYGDVYRDAGVRCYGCDPQAAIGSFQNERAPKGHIWQCRNTPCTGWHHEPRVRWVEMTNTGLIEDAGRVMHFHCGSKEAPRYSFGRVDAAYAAARSERFGT
jgi:hypothetical protein